MLELYAESEPRRYEEKLEIMSWIALSPIGITK